MVCARVHFRSRLLLHAKIKHQAIKKAKKTATATGEMLREVHAPTQRGIGGEEGSELAALREKVEALIVEANGLRGQVQQLEADNKRLQRASSYSRKGKRELCEKVMALGEGPGFGLGLGLGLGIGLGARM